MEKLGLQVLPGSSVEPAFVNQLALDASPRPTLMPTDPGLHASCLRTCLVSKKLSSHSTCRIFYSEISNSRIPLLPDSLVTSRLIHEDMELFIQ